jgi:hypothetical protein
LKEEDLEVRVTLETQLAQEAEAAAEQLATVQLETTVGVELDLFQLFQDKQQCMAEADMDLLQMDHMGFLDIMDILFTMALVVKEHQTDTQHQVHLVLVEQMG